MKRHVLREISRPELSSKALSMGTAKMSRTSDQAEKPDDLIAELARLMAADAQGDGSEQPPAGGQSGQSAAATTAPSDRLRATRGSTSLYDADEQPAARQTSRFAASGASAQAVLERPAGRSPETSSNGNYGSGTTEDPRSDHLSTVDERFEEDALSELGAYQPDSTSAEALADRFDDVAGASPADTSSNDPIADLIAAQLEQENLSFPPAAPVEVPSKYEETDQFADEQPFPPEDDNFSVSPSLGLGGTEHNAEESRRKYSDPLQEIENLIGDAVRVGVPQPADENATTKRDGTDFNNVAIQAEAAIRAAEAATSENHSDVGSSNDDDLHAALAQQSPQPTSEIYADERPVMRPVWHRAIGPVVAGTLLLAIGFGLYWVFGSDGATNVDAPVLTANPTPVKELPETPGVEDTAASRSVVFDELSGDTEPGNTEQIVSRDQSVDANGGDVSRVITGVASTSDAGLANRKVRTVTVRPDGTIVSADDTLAGGEVLPVDRPNVPDLPEGTTNVASEFANEPMFNDTPAEASLVAPAANLPTTAETGLANALEPLVAQSSNAPIPRPRPARAPSSPTSVFTNTEPLITNSIGSSPASTNDEAVDLLATLANNSVSSPQGQPASQGQTVADVPPSLVGTYAPAYVQLSSQRSVAGAQASLTEMQRRYSSSLSGHVLEIQQVELGEKGTYFRVRMPSNSIEEANRVCGEVKRAGGDCFVRTN